MQLDGRALIVGGGVGGLGTALALSSQGYASRLLERAPEFSEIGAGIQLGPNFMRSLDTLGLRQRVLADAWIPQRLIFRNAVSGERITEIPVDERFRERFGAEYALIHRADLLAALLEACERDPMIELCPDSEASSVSTHDDLVTVDLLDGRSDSAPLLVGADGLWSKVREHVIGDGAPRPAGHIAYRAVLKAKDVPDDLWSDDMNVWLGPRTHLVTYPMRRGELYNLVAVFHSDRYAEGYDRAGELDELWRHFGGECSQVQRLLKRTESWRYWVLCDREPRRGWSKGHVTLVGDAAHPMLQYLAQGAAMSVEDGLCVAAALRDSDSIPQALQRYEEARLKRTARAQVISRIYGVVFHVDDVIAEMRDDLISSWKPEQHWNAMSWMYDYRPDGDGQAA